MKFSIISLVTVLFAISILFASCQKEKIEAPTTKTKTTTETASAVNGVAVADAPKTCSQPTPR